MITRHHLGLAFGSMLILYFPVIFADFVVLAAIASGVCIGVVLPDIQMKKPRTFRALSLAWILVQVFKRTVLYLNIHLYQYIFRIQPESDDKRLTHSLPGVVFLTGMIVCILVIIMWAFPAPLATHSLKFFLAGIIAGLVFHFLEDTCTKKGMYPFYPFNETYHISGSIQPCNTKDPRIRLFHIQAIAIVVAIILLYGSGLCPEYLKWPVSVSAMGICILLMIYKAEVRVVCPVPITHIQSGAIKRGGS